MKILEKIKKSKERKKKGGRAKSCSPSLSGGHQVDGVPPACKSRDERRDDVEILSLSESFSRFRVLHPGF